MAKRTDLRSVRVEIETDRSPRIGENRPGFPWIVYADTEVAFVLAGNSMFKVELPTG